MILSLWKRILNIAKYVFLFIGSLCVLSGIITFSLACLADMGHHTMLFLFATVWGLGFIVRYWCIRKYKSAFYSSCLFKSYKKDSHDFHTLLKFILLYEAAYIVAFHIAFLPVP